MRYHLCKNCGAGLNLEGIEKGICGKCGSKSIAETNIPYQEGDYLGKAGTFEGSVVNCSLRMKRCHYDWDDFEKTKNITERFCTDCETIVKRVYDDEELQQVASEGKCVAYKVKFSNDDLVGVVDSF